MGQAKQRQSEIIALKAKGAKIKALPIRIEGFGAYYKDLDDDGVSVMLSRTMGVPQDFLDLMYSTVKECVDVELDELAKGNYAYFNGAATREDAIKHIWNQLKICIHNYNIAVFGTSVRPLKHKYMTEVNKDFLETAFPIMGNIWMLDKLGEIPNDNYNGMTFAYSN
jgi:hypothetical protein